jgi:CHAT domain-containing protein
MSAAGTARPPALVWFRPRRFLPAAIIALAAAAFGLALAGPTLAEGTSPEVAAAVRAAEEAQAQGRHRQAVEILARALAEGEGRRGPADMGVLHGSLGSAHLLAREPDQARAHLERSLEIARGQDLAGIEAATLINLGNLHAAEDRLGDALDAYLAAAARAGAAGRRDLASRARLDAARVLARQGDAAGAAARLDAAWGDLHARRGDPEAAFDLLALARLLLDLPPTPARGARAYEVLREAAALARSAGDDRLMSYATGYMAQLYEVQGRTDEALALSRRAAWLAQAAGASDPLYAWQRQIGRLLAARGQEAEAIGAYQDAVRTLQDIRLDLPTFDPRTGRSLFREVVGPVFLELTDLLLKRAAETGGAAAQAYLKEARLAIETTKAAELQDYFQDDCVAELQARIRPIDRLAAGTAALYPIMLPDRTELLLSLPDGAIQRATAQLGAAAMALEAHALRLALETRSSRRYLVPARNLYDLLLRPFEGEMARQRVDTLVFVPDGALRTIPLAALHDGRGFVVDRYAVATAPGLNLLDPRPIRRADIKPLLAGLTREVQGFAPLPHVEAELKAIARQHAGFVLLDEAFVAPKLQRSLQSTPFSVVHIASHGQFASDPKDSFLLTFDGRLDIDSLERLIEPSRFREAPVELLTLSACTTAAGDDRAALGLAGIAVKAGARSALASLWFINDEASAELVAAFYRALDAPGTSKAEALRQAQRGLMQDRRYRHPAYWAPFLIIGNWL